MAAEKKKLGVKEKKEENYIKKGGNGLKNTSFWASPRPPQTYL